VTATSTASAVLPDPKRAVLDHAEEFAGSRDKWRRRNAYFYEEDDRYLRFLIPAGKRVLDLGCGNGATLAALAPAHGVGVDLSPRSIAFAKGRHPGLDFRVGDIEDQALIASLDGPFDFILLADTCGDLQDVDAAFARLHDLCDAGTRIVVVYHSPLWAPLLKFGEKVGLRMPQRSKNWLWQGDIGALLDLADFEVVRTEWRTLLPRRMLGLGSLVNRFVATLPGFRRLCLRNFVVARSLKHAVVGYRSVSILIPARNERGNIEPAIQRIPRFAPDMEILFVEGHSKDGTLQEMERVRDAYPDWDIKVMAQPGKGKADAVWTGFDVARGDVLMILDADLTMPPEALPKFWNAIASGKGEYINGSRLVYPMEDGAMQFLNRIANHTFSILFTWLLNQRFTDTLCGTKVLSRKHYQVLKANRAYFGDFDPFGDFDLIFGSVKQHLKVVEIPIRYAARSYGTTQISRFRHGVLLLKMVVFAYRKLKAL
jgi:SAM-dependent methyltransferase